MGFFDTFAGGIALQGAPATYSSIYQAGIANKKGIADKKAQDSRWAHIYDVAGKTIDKSKYAPWRYDDVQKGFADYATAIETMRHTNPQDTWTAQALTNKWKQSQTERENEGISFNKILALPPEELTPAMRDFVSKAVNSKSGYYMFTMFTKLQKLFAI